MAAFDQGPLAKYNSLTDRHLMNYFSNDRMRRHLLKSGLITKGGEVVSDTLYRVKIARREHRRRVRDLIAQAIIHKALEMERSRQIDIRKKIEEIAKIELVRRVRTDRSRMGDEECLAYFNEGDMGKRSKSAKARTKSLRSQSDNDEFKLPPTTDEESRLRLQKLLPNEELETKHLSQLDSLTLGEYAKILEKQDKYRMNKLPYLGMGNEFVLRPKPRRRKPPMPQKLAPNLLIQSDKEEKMNDVVLSQSARSSQPKVATRPQVSILFNAPSVQRTFDVMVEQQPSGGNTLVLFKETISNNTVFHLTSHRHKGFPFSLTFYIDNVKDSRISTCCEYKHKIGKRIGGPAGHFTLFKVEGDNPCYKCLAEKDLADEKKGRKPKGEVTEHCLDSNNLFFDKFNTHQWRKSNYMDYYDMCTKEIPRMNHKKYNPRSKHPYANIKSLKVRMPFVDFYAKSNEQGSSRHETISVRSTSADPYKSADEFESDNNSSKVASDSEGENRHSKRNSQEQEIILSDDPLVDSTRAKTPEIEVEDPDFTQAEIQKESSNNNAMEKSKEEDKKASVEVKDENLEENKAQNNDLSTDKETEDNNISSSYDSSYTSDEPNRMAAKNKNLKNFSSEDETVDDNKVNVPANKNFILPKNNDSEYETSSGDNIDKVANVNNQPNSFLNKVLDYDSNSSTSRSNDLELEKNTENELQNNNNNADHFSDSDIVKDYPIPRVGAGNYFDQSNVHAEDSPKNITIEGEVHDEGTAEIDEMSHKSQSDIHDIKDIDRNSPLKEDIAKTGDKSESGYHAEDESEHRQNIVGSMEHKDPKNEEKIIEEIKPASSSSIVATGSHDRDFIKDSPKDEEYKNENLSLVESENNNKANILYESQLPDSDHLDSQRTLDSPDSGGSSSSEYYSSSAPTEGSVNRKTSSIIQTPRLTENERISLKIDIPKEEEEVGSMNNDETKLENSRKISEHYEIPKLIERNEDMKEDRGENDSHKGGRSSLQRPPSSFTSSSFFGTETESELPIEVEHQPEEDIPINENKDIIQESLFEEFDVFFENDDITFKKAKDKFETIGEQRVTSLIVRNCELPSYIFNFISNKLEGKKDLKRIELTGCEVEISLLKLLAKALDKWPVLDTLIISNNVFVDYSLFDLINTIGHVYSNDKEDKLSLKVFDISKCGLQENDFGQVIKMIAANTRVENIVLDQNPINEGLWMDLKQALEKNSNTKSVSIKDCVTDATLLSTIDNESSSDISSRLILS